MSWVNNLEPPPVRWLIKILSEEQCLGGNLWLQERCETQKSERLSDRRAQSSLCWPRTRSRTSEEKLQECRGWLNRRTLTVRAAPHGMGCLEVSNQGQPDQDWVKDPGRSLVVRILASDGLLYYVNAFLCFLQEECHPSINKPGFWETSVATHTSCLI